MFSTWFPSLIPSFLIIYFSLTNILPLFSPPLFPPIRIVQRMPAEHKRFYMHSGTSALFPLSSVSLALVFPSSPIVPSSIPFHFPFYLPSFNPTFLPAIILSFKPVKRSNPGTRVVPPTLRHQALVLILSGLQGSPYRNYRLVLGMRYALWA